MRAGKPTLLAQCPFLTRAEYSTVPISYTLFDPEGDAVGRVAASYSLNGGGQWQPAVATTDTLTTNLATASVASGGREHTFIWDTFASGFFGQSDNVVLRLQAYPQPGQSASPSTFTYPNRTPGLNQRPYASATTFPFRVRGTQVQVYSDTVKIGNAVANAIVYHLPKEQARGALPMRDSSGVAYRTNAQGFLQGQGQLAIDDRIVALLPITSTHTYTLYHTSAAATLSGLDPFTMTTSGVQKLVVSSTNPLILFDLDVSLE